MNMYKYSYNTMLVNFGYRVLNDVSDSSHKKNCEHLWVNSHPAKLARPAYNIHVQMSVNTFKNDQSLQKIIFISQSHQHIQ